MAGADAASDDGCRRGEVKLKLMMKLVLALVVACLWFIGMGGKDHDNEIEASLTRRVRGSFEAHSTRHVPNAMTASLRRSLRFFFEAGLLRLLSTASPPTSCLTCGIGWLTLLLSLRVTLAPTSFHRRLAFA